MSHNWLRVTIYFLWIQTTQSPPKHFGGNLRGKIKAGLFQTHDDDLTFANNQELTLRKLPKTSKCKCGSNHVVHGSQKAPISSVPIYFKSSTKDVLQMPIFSKLGIPMAVDTSISFNTSQQETQMQGGGNMIGPSLHVSIAVNNISVAATMIKCE